jgi:hypothetical protein
VRGAEVGGVGGGPVGWAVVARDGVRDPRDLGGGGGAAPGLLGLARGRALRRRAPHGPGRRRRRVAPGPGGQRREGGSGGADGESESHRTCSAAAAWDWAWAGEGSDGLAWLVALCSLPAVVGGAVEETSGGGGFYKRGCG